MKSRLIVMLTQNDSTVPDALEVFGQCADLPVDFWGFKDVGLPIEKMKELVASMKRAGKTTFLEVVTLKEEDCMRGARLAVECDFDFLMGTVFFDSVFDYLRQHGTRYFPFCGKVHGHPSILGGTVEEIVSDGKRLQERGVAGLDILAWRHPSQPEDIARALVKSLSIPVVVAGSINSFRRIDTVNDLDPWAFTIGSALFEKKFTPGATFRGQLEAVLRYMESVR